MKFARKSISLQSHNSLRLSRKKRYWGEALSVTVARITLFRLRSAICSGIECPAEKGCSITLCQLENVLHLRFLITFKLPSILVSVTFCVGDLTDAEGIRVCFLSYLCKMKAANELHSPSFRDQPALSPE